MLIDLSYSKVADANFAAGEIITIKKGGSVWAENELGPDHGLVTLELTPEQLGQLQADLGAFKVDNVENPQAIIPGA